jgi:hypothetical protein
MSAVTRRTLLAGAAGVGGLVLVPITFTDNAPSLHVFDSRLRGSKRSARAVHDLANEDGSLWRASRDLRPGPGDRVTGMTRWSDWIAMRGLLGERGLRARSLSVKGNIAIWEMS